MKNEFAISIIVFVSLLDNIPLKKHIRYYQSGVNYKKIQYKKT